MQVGEKPLVIADFLSEAEEENLIKLIDSQVWVSNRDNSRRVQISGPYHDSKYRIIPGKFSRHPDFILGLSQNIRDIILPLINDPAVSSPDAWGTHDHMEVYINEFLPGASLAPHYDHRTTYEDLIIGISLSSDSKLTFTHGTNNKKEKVDIPRRSLYAMYGISRNLWKHGLEKEDIKARRVSITFRTIRVSRTARESCITLESI